MICLCVALDTASNLLFVGILRFFGLLTILHIATNAYAIFLLVGYIFHSNTCASICSLYVRSTKLLLELEPPKHLGMMWCSSPDSGVTLCLLPTNLSYIFE